MPTPLFYQSKSIFGVDIGQASVKITQLRQHSGVAEVVGYGYSQFDPAATDKGSVVKPEIIAATIKTLLEKQLVGKISTDRIVGSLPISHTYTRLVSLPELKDEDLEDAIKLEIEQYIPVSIDDLYFVWHKISASHEPAPKHHLDVKAFLKKDLKTKKPARVASGHTLVLVVAAPKHIVDSYLKVFERLSLNTMAIEPTVFANLRALNFTYPSKQPRVVIDFGSHSSDIAIYDGVVRLVSTVDTGGDHITNQIMKTLNLSREQAEKVKAHYGIAKSRWQAKLANGLQPILSDFANEVQKTMRYYHDHHRGNSNIANIIMVGGGANMPGLVNFLTHLTGVEVVVANPWEKLKFNSLQPPYGSETSLYTTAVGLALKEFADD